MKKEYILFYGYSYPFSNFHTTISEETFEYEGEQCKCSEQAYVLAKAIEMKDIQTENKIREAIKENTFSASFYKNLSKKIKGNIEIWDSVKYDKMVEILKLKFEIPRLKYQLKKTGDKILVESSRDLYWGSGYYEKEKYAEIEEKWKGKNMLGKALMEVRDFYFGGTE